MKDGVLKISPYQLSHKHYETGLFQQMGLLALCQADEKGVWMTNGKSVYLFKKNNFYELAFKNESHTFIKCKN